VKANSGQNYAQKIGPDKLLLTTRICSEKLKERHFEKSMKLVQASL
jgi:hypothetical protein